MMDFATPGVFATARDGPDEIDTTFGKKLEVKTYESRYDSSGKRICLQAGTRRREAELKEKDHESALVLTMFYGIDKELRYTELEVKSPYMIAALRKTIKEYPGLTFNAGKIILRDQPRCIFHYRNELREYGINLQDHIAVQHLLFLLNYMYSTLSNEISSYYAFMESPTADPGIQYSNLWMAFRPGDLIYTLKDGIHRVLKLKSIEKGWFYWNLELEKIANDGTSFGCATESISIDWYEGYMPLKLLCAFPLQYHPQKETISETLRARGKKYCALHGVHHRFYAGKAFSSSPFQGSFSNRYTAQSIIIKGRIIVDCAKFAEVRPSQKVKVSKKRAKNWKRVEQPYDSDEDILSEDESEVDAAWKDGEVPAFSNNELIICDNVIPGFSLSTKRWCFFELDYIQEFKYNTEAFKSLVLAEEQKSMIHSLVRIHADERLQFDDLIEGKGKGMIFLLHGEPGVGKTLTAESIADYTERPLYTISSGDLGANAASTEQALKDVLELATCWNAIVLIDEADVFLEQRSHHDLERNGLVSVFLRLLEYYEGIMFLTTNRIGSFDAAFKSRIHLAIKYPPLSVQSQRDIWITFLNSGSTTNQHSWLDDKFLDSVASERLNGRQIKNIVRTAKALALAAGRELRPNDIKMSLKAIKDFEQDFVEGKDNTETGQNDPQGTTGHGGSSGGEHRAKRQRQI